MVAKQQLRCDCVLEPAREANGHGVRRVAMEAPRARVVGDATRLARGGSECSSEVWQTSLDDNMTQQCRQHSATHLRARIPSEDTRIFQAFGGEAEDGSVAAILQAWGTLQRPGRLVRPTP
jgi:hypothetical protein